MESCGQKDFNLGDPLTAQLVEVFLTYSKGPMKRNRGGVLVRTEKEFDTMLEYGTCDIPVTVLQHIFGP